MLKLLKYEIIKKWKTLCIALIIFGIVDIISVILLYGGQINTAVGIMLYSFLGFAGIIFLLVDNINTYKNDLFKKSGYMLFLTPNSGYKILGSKVIIAFFENILGFIIYFLLGLINYNILSENLFRVGNDTSSNLQVLIEVNSYDVLVFFLIGIIIIAYWFNFMLSIYLSMTIFKSTLSNSEHGGVISFLIFLGVNFILNIIYGVVLGTVFSNFNFTLSFELNTYTIQLAQYLLPTMLILVCIGGLLYIITGYLLNRKVNL